MALAKLLTICDVYAGVPGHRAEIQRAKLPDQRHGHGLEVVGVRAIIMHIYVYIWRYKKISIYFVLLGTFDGDVGSRIASQTQS